MNENNIESLREAFAKKYLNKTVRPLGKHYQLPIKAYFVTAALYNYEDNGDTIFAIMASDYSPENKHWFTIRIAREEFDICMGDFEIINEN